MTAQSEGKVREILEQARVCPDKTELGRFCTACQGRIAQSLADIERVVIPSEEELIALIKSFQIDIGHHRYGNRERKEIRDCCNVDIKDTAHTIHAELVRRMDKQDRIQKAIDEAIEPLKISKGILRVVLFNKILAMVEEKEKVELPKEQPNFTNADLYARTETLLLLFNQLIRYLRQEEEER
jgi:hypothetical protein